MPSLNDVKKPAPLVYIGPERRMKAELSAIRVSTQSGRVVTAARIVQGLIDRYLDIYLDEITARSTK